ncbi:hypothetical protein A2U01_0110814, partial [Trifolium medium]|nr:hypothetical protein [Trifolium medium]
PCPRVAHATEQNRQKTAEVGALRPLSGALRPGQTAT